MTTGQNTLATIAQKRETYAHLQASLVACGRSLSECACWHYDGERLEGIAQIGRYIQNTSEAMQGLLSEIRRLEAKILGA
ncbi:hypothetical protein D3C87_488880 [compost metagenome]